ncbi:hypothetical protein [Croceicoccus marinus]|uniref:Secreted protein n=1 Tax=Croceicoccus marinus TaxID=450378 RepID=A0A1Z1FAW5_9SPHN|nr:hypothetical protein [Croceicoccus marinus]ARU15866.1 hypothetical protein A9D14_06280 [Croceicoccus marinus]
MMDTVNPIVWIAIAGVVIAALLIWYFIARSRTNRLRSRFGDEYDRTVATTGSTGRAEHDLEDRQRRVASFDIRPLSHDERDRFASEWTEVKSLFVNSPAEAVLRADRTIGSLMKARGFPVADFDQRHADLTVDHPEVARHYREGHDIAARQSRDATGQAIATEDLRQALVHYEALFEDLISDVEDRRNTVSTSRVSTGSVSTGPVSTGPIGRVAEPSR